MKSKVLLLCAVALLAAIAAFGCKPAETPDAEGPKETITLKYAFFAPAGTFPAVQMEEWARLVEERTDGWVKVETFPGGTLLGPTNMFDGVLEGVAEIGLSCPSYEPGRFPLIELVDFPVSFPNAEVASVVFWHLVQEFQPDELKDFKVITVFATEPAYIQSKTRVASLEDLKGMELRSAGTGVTPLKALGASPVGMPQSAVGEALQTGVISGYASSREVLFDFKYAETVKFVVDYPIFQISFAALMEREVWDALPQDVKKVIDDLGLEMAVWTGKYLDGHCVKAVEWAMAEEDVEVVTLTAEEKAKWDAVLQPLVDDAANSLEAKGLPGKAFLKKLYELRDKYSK